MLAAKELRQQAARSIVCCGDPFKGMQISLGSSAASSLGSHCPVSVLDNAMPIPVRSNSKRAASI